MFELVLFLSKLTSVCDYNFHFVCRAGFQSIHVAFWQRTEQNFGIAVLYLERIKQRNIRRFVVDMEFSKRVSAEGILRVHQPGSFVKILYTLRHHVDLTAALSKAFKIRSYPWCVKLASKRK